MSGGPRVGVLALQGDVREHLHALTALGADAVGVRRREEVESVDGLIIPGGESTTMSRLLDVFELRKPLQDRLSSGMAAFGSCAGMIMLATEIREGRPDQVPLAAIDITVRRNAFGRQVDSFESDLDVDGIDGPPVRAVFIRAPWVERVGDSVTVLAAVGEHPVAVRAGNVLATSFHPEITGDRRVHELFLRMVVGAAS